MLPEKELLYIEETALSLAPYASRHRRNLHRIPETAWNEFRTTEYLEKELSELGYTIIKGNAFSGHPTGLLAEIGIEQTPVVGLRFDIDALPVTETSAASHLPNQEDFRSCSEGSMHACGHDGHMAIGLTVARLLSENREKLHGKVRLLFQPAEEGCKGARPIVERGWLNDVDYFLSGHITGQEYGQTDEGPADCVTGANGSLATTKINASFTGISCHGACPENGASAISALCTAVTALNSIPRNSGGSTMINIGKISGGEGRNIVARHAEMELEVRGETTELNQYMEDQAISIIHAAASLHHCTADVEIIGKAPSLISSPDFHEKINALLQKLTYTKISTKPERFRASEDASLLMEQVKGHGGKAVFMFFPTKTTAPLHRNDYNFSEDILCKAASIFTAVTMDLLQ